MPRIDWCVLESLYHFTVVVLTSLCPFIVTSSPFCLIQRAHSHSISFLLLLPQLTRRWRSSIVSLTLKQLSFARQLRYDCSWKVECKVAGKNNRVHCDNLRFRVTKAGIPDIIDGVDQKEEPRAAVSFHRRKKSFLTKKIMKTMLTMFTKE